MEIAKAKDGDVQVALAEAYENKSLPGNQLLAIRRIIEIRNTSGRGMRGGRGSGSRTRSRATADLLVRAFKKETERQKALVRKAALAQSRLIFIVNALRRLLTDEHFATLLRAEAIQSIPLPLAERMAWWKDLDGPARQSRLRQADRCPAAYLHLASAHHQFRDETVDQVPAHRAFDQRGRHH